MSVEGLEPFEFKTRCPIALLNLADLLKFKEGWRLLLQPNHLNFTQNTGTYFVPDLPVNRLDPCALVAISAFHHSFNDLSH